jgi:monomeric isocitrate dehydrogenase
MKRIVPILIIGIMVLSGLGAAAVSHTAQKPMENVDRWDAECQ